MQPVMNINIGKIIYILHLQERALEFWVKRSSMEHIIFLREHKAEDKAFPSPIVGLTKSDQKREGNF